MQSRFPALLLFLFAAFARLEAQTSGTLRGSVVDPSGAAVPGARIALTGPNNSRRTADSDSSGNFSVAGLPPGNYAIQTTAPGFEPSQNTLNVSSGRIATLDIHLSVALDRQEVTVVDSDQTQVAVDPGQNASATVVTDKDLTALGDNPDDLENDLLALAGPSVGPSGGQIFIDGFSNGQLPSKESIREVRINSNPFSAEYDRPGTGRIEIITKPGADKLHGGFSGTVADSVLNARNPFSTSKPPTQARLFDANFGAPIRSKASFTVEGGHQKQDNTALINADTLDAALQPVHVNQMVATPAGRSFVSPRLDIQLSPNLTLQSRYYYNHGTYEKNGIGGFNLPSRATNYDYTQNTMQITLTRVIGARMANETRLQVGHLRYDNRGDADSPGINVLGAFYGGGASSPLAYTHSYNTELQNNTSYTRGRHFVKFGVRLRGPLLDSYSTNNFNGTYTFTSLNAYAQTVQGLAQGLSMDQIRAQGGGPSQYSVAGGTPLTSVHQIDASPYIQDDFRIAPNFTLSTGLRYEVQTNIEDHHSWAPRVGIAWGLGKGQGGTRSPKTVLRLGYGIFYERIDQQLTLQTLRQNGVTQQNFLVTAPDFFPSAPSLTQLIANRQPQAVQLLQSSIRAPEILQGAASLERQLPHNITLSLSYTNSRGLHQLRSRNINAPVPGSGVYPFGNPGQLYLYEDSALFKQSQVSLNVNARVNKTVSLFGSYTYNRAFSNSDGSGTFPANNYDLSTEWGRATFDIRHRAQIGGSLVLPWNIQVAPLVTFASGPPVNITTGEDSNADTNFNDRPGFATIAPDQQGVIATPWGVFNKRPFTNPAAGAVLIPRNYGTGFGAISINGRISRTWTFGEPAGGNRGGKAPGRYSLSAGVQARNWINHVNPSQPIANLSSPFLGHALSLSTGASANRRLELNLRFSF